MDEWQIAGIVVPPLIAGAVWGYRKISSHDTDIAVVKTKVENIEKTTDRIDSSVARLVEHILEQKNGVPKG